LELIKVLQPGDSYIFETPNLELHEIEALKEFKFYKATRYVPEGIYTPEDFGFDLPKCSQINVGYCAHFVSRDRIEEKRSLLDKILFMPPSYRYTAEVKTVTFRESEPRFSVIGHTASGVNDTHICLTNGNYVYGDDNKPSETVLHEYAHLMAGAEAHHGKFWEMAMIELGVAPEQFADYMVI